MAQVQNVLLQRYVVQRDEEAFNEIVHQYSGLVYGACWRVLQDKDRVADAVQETFMQLLLHAESITGSLSGWLHRVATRMSIDRIRKDSARQRRETRLAQDQTQQVRQWQDISAYLDKELDRLDNQTRHVLIEHFFKGQTTRAIAAELEVSQSTVSRRVEAGVKLLRDRLQRRGLFATTALLGGLLTENAVQAAPAMVLKELGKMAMIGSQAAQTTQAVATTSWPGHALWSTTAGKAVTAATIGVVTVGSALTVQHFRGSSTPSNPDQAAVVTTPNTPTPDNPPVGGMMPIGGAVGGMAGPMPGPVDVLEQTEPNIQEDRVREGAMGGMLIGD